MSQNTTKHQFTGLLGIAAALALNAAASAAEIHVPDQYPLIQIAIDVAADGDVIIVAQKDFLEHIDLKGKAITLRSTDPSNPSVVANTRIIGPAPQPTVSCITGEGPDTVIAGFTITHLNPAASGTGMYIDSASPTVSYCVFTDNLTSANGGGINIRLGSPTIRSCVFDENSALVGGGIFIAEGDPFLEYCDIRFNSATIHGGGIYSEGGGLTMSVCMFYENAAMSGGGLRTANSNTQLAECYFVGNSADQGGGLYVGGGDMTMTDCELGENTCADAGGAMFVYECDPVMTDCKFYGDDDDWTVDSIAGHVWTIQSPAPPVTGACCLADGVCMVGTEDACISAGGTYMGDYTTCADADCPEPCPADANGDGFVDIDDVFEVLAKWGPCP